jgi:hypothetical protein
VKNERIAFHDVEARGTIWSVMENDDLIAWPDPRSPLSVPATRPNLARALQFIGQKKGGGGTRLLAALERAVAVPRQREASRSIVLVTDGYIEAEADVFDYVRAGDQNFRKRCDQNFRNPHGFCVVEADEAIDLAREWATTVTSGDREENGRAPGA